MPAEAKAKANARRHRRRSLPLLVQYRFSLLEEFHTDYSVNISGGGLYLKMARPPAVGATIYLQFIMRGGGRIIQCRGRVIRVDVLDPGAGCAVQFIDLDDEDLDAITALVNQP